MAKFKLPPEAVVKLREAQRNFHDVLPELDKLEECGVDCQALRQAMVEKQDQVDKLLTYFGPAVGKGVQQTAH